jgi:hypothetical protein
MITINGNTPDEKIQHIEKILNKMSRKLHKTVVGIMPPVPVMLSVDAPKEDGNIFTFLTPGKGTITDICLYVKEFIGNDPVKFEAESKSDVSGQMTSFITRKHIGVYALNLSVVAGSMLTLKTPTPEKVKGIWLSFLYQMGIERAEQTKYLVSEFEKLMEGQDAEIEGGDNSGNSGSSRQVS